MSMPDLETENALLRERVDELEARLRERNSQLLDAHSRLRMEVSDHHGTRQESDIRAALLDAASDIVVLCDSIGSVHYLNQAAERFGFALGKTITSTMRIRYPELSEDSVMRRLHSILSSGSASWEIVSECAEHPCHFEIHAHVVAHNQEPLILASMHDVTVRKQAEQVRRESEQKYSALFAQAAVPAALVKLPGYVFADVNQAFSRTFGFTKQELLGTNVSQIGMASPGDWTNVHDDFDAHRQIHEYEMPLVTREGTPLTVLVNATIVEFAGEPYALATLYDITARKQAERALLDSQAQYRLLADNVTDVVWVMDVATMRFTYMSPSVERQLGYTPSELIGQTFEGFFAPASLETIREQWAVRVNSFLAGNHPTLSDVGEFEQIARDGSSVWVEVSSTMLRDGQNVSVVGVSRDITKRKKAQLALDTSRSQYRLLAENVSDVVMVIDLKRFQLSYVSPSVESASGFTPNEIIGQSFEQLIAPAARARVQEHFIGRVRAFMAGDSSVMTETAEIELMCKDGAMVWTELSTTLVSHASNPIAVGVARVITERKRAEQAARESEQKYAALFAQAAVPAALVQLPENAFADVNKAFLTTFGYSKQEIIGKQPTDLGILEPVDQERITYQLQEHGSAQNLELRFHTKAGTVIDGLVSANAVEFGEHRYAIATVTDLTVQRQAEQALRESELCYHDLFDTATLAIFQSTLTGKMMRVNPEFARMFGYASPQDAVQKLTDVASGIYADPDRRAEIIQALTTAPHRHEFESLYRRQDGSTFWGEAFVRCLTDAQGTVIGFDGFVKDITERKQAEQALYIALTKYKTLFDNLPFGITVSDQAGNILEANLNAEALLGISTEEHARRKISGEEWKIIRPDGTPMPAKEYASVRALTEQRKIENIEMGIVKPDRHVTWINVTATPIPLDGYGVVIAYADISQRKQTEREISETRDYLKKIIDESAVAISLVRMSDHTFVEFNPAAGQLFGHTRAEVIGKPWNSFNYWVDPREGERPVELFAGQDGYLRDFEFQFRHKSGAIGWASLYSRIIEQHGEKYFLTEFVDITARKHAEAELGRLAERLSLATRAGQLGIWDWDVVQDRLVWDDKMFELFGMPPGGADAHYTKELWLNSLHPDDLAREYELTGLRLRGERDYETQFRVIWQDGSVHWIQAHGQVYRDASGTPLRVVGVNYDVTDRKHAEQALQASEEKYAVLFHQAAIPALLAQLPENRIVDVNSAFERTFGFSRQELIGKSSVQAGLARPFERARVYSDFEAHGFLQGSEIQLLTKSGDSLIGMLEANTVQFGGHAYAIVTVQDVTQRREAERALQQRSHDLARANAELAQANRTKDEFLAMMSHELRTPLNTVLGMAESLQAQIYGPLNPRQIESLEWISKSGNHLLSLINEILLLSKIQAGKVEPRFQPTGLQEVCQTALQSVQAAVRAKNLKVLYHTDTANIVLLADERLLYQVLLNLLSNAIKFTPGEGTITLAVHSDAVNRVAQISVTDTGIGISPQDRERVFEPFVQIDSGLNRSYQGTGLGLALAANLVKLHHGSISLQSAEGQGSCFTVTLPYPESSAVLPQNKAPASLPVTFPVDATPSHKPVVLVADDNEGTLAVLREYLEAVSFEVLLARDGREAVTLARRHNPDIILMDIQMPVLNGIQAMQELHAVPELAHTPVIALTALVMPGDRERCLAAGAVEYLPKPLRLAELPARLRSYLASSKSDVGGQ